MHQALCLWFSVILADVPIKYLLFLILARRRTRLGFL